MWFTYSAGVPHTPLPYHHDYAPCPPRFVVMRPKVCYCGPHDFFGKPRKMDGWGDEKVDV